MSPQFSAALLDSNLAPGVSAFTRAEIPDIAAFSKESTHWVANFFLNCSFRGAFAPPMNAYALNYLRRSQNAFAEYIAAGQLTSSFLSSGGQSVTSYTGALYHWECFLGQAWHAYAILMTAWNGKAFERNDGSVHQRLNSLYNEMKHVESRIDNAQMIPGATVPVWLENAGLRSVDAHLSFAEAAEILRELAEYADALVDPLTAKAKFTAGNP
jgi:hypothetical protein